MFVETFLYGAFAGLVFAWLYNVVSRGLGAERIVAVVLLAGAAQRERRMGRRPCRATPRPGRFPGANSEEE